MIETFLISWNEEDTIEFTIKHYLKLGKVNLYDNHSTDKTREIADKLGAYVTTFGTQELNDKEYLKVKNHVWKNSSADFVIVCDSDEILQVDKDFLIEERKKGVTIFNTFGFNIFSTKMPKEDWSELDHGIPDVNFSKKVIFSPTLKEINYIYGCHQCLPHGSIKYSEKTLPLFHYRCVGGENRLIKRHKAYKKRMSDFNKRLRLGHHYLQEENKKRKEWQNCLERSVKFSPDIIS